jgi:hypothetical protein
MVAGEIDLIYTSKGNLPVKDLTRKVEWIFSQGSIEFKERYYLGEEMVKEGSDVYLLPIGTELYIKQGDL